MRSPTPFVLSVVLFVPKPLVAAIRVTRAGYTPGRVIPINPTLIGLYIVVVVESVTVRRYLIDRKGDGLLTSFFAYRIIIGVCRAISDDKLRS